MAANLCTRCKRPFREGQLLQATVITTYHEFMKPGMDAYKYALERPSAFSNVHHLCCAFDEEVI